MAQEEPGGRVFFSNTGRSMETEDEIELTSVGIDIGSSTSHLAFSKIVLERLDTRYIVVERTLLHESEVQLTPYSADDTIDADALGVFIRAQYALAGLTPDQIDTGALILTGVAVRRRNARAIGDLFSAESGRFVVVSAGDGLEATLAAFGSGAVARSGRGTGTRVLNIDIGGGTSKLALCEGGSISAITAIDIGARVVAYDATRRIVRIEDAGRYFAKQIGLSLDLGSILSVEDADRLAGTMADHLFAALRGGDLPADLVALHRLPPLPAAPPPDVVAVSGGVAEFFYDETTQDFGDLGLVLARAIRARLEAWDAVIEQPDQGIRATVVGASQYTVQVSGSTIFVQPVDLLPLRNLPVIKPDLPFSQEIDADAVAASIRHALTRLDMASGEHALAVYYRFSGSATYHRLDAFCRGVLKGLSEVLDHGHPLVLVADSDVGGLIGMHCFEALGVQRLISIDGIALEEFDFIDIGAILSTSGAVPVVIKSLVFPTQGLGRSALELEKT
jgi:ethanolamine utilization protein EutA